MLTTIGQILAGFGLSTASGLNAYIPLLLVGLAGRLGWLHLAQPFDLLQNEWVLGVLVVLLAIEMLVDKVPGVDTVNDVIQTLVRPTAGAILFAAEAKVITDLSPVVAIALGLLVSFSVHATKATVRPVVSAATIGTGNWAVSLLEDIVSFFLSGLALIAPYLGALLVLLLILWLVRWFAARRRNAPRAAASPPPLRWPR